MRGVFQALGRQFHDSRQIFEISRPESGLKLQFDLKTKNSIGIRKFYGNFPAKIEKFE